MPTITFTLPVAGTDADAGPIATNFANLQSLLNGGLDADNLDDMGATTGQALVWNGADWAPGSAGAMTQLSSTLLASTAANFDISSISQNYNHLVLHLLTRCDNAVTAQDLFMRFNNDSAANYDTEFVQVNNVSVAALSGEAVTSIRLPRTLGSSSPASHAAHHVIDINFYKGTTFFKGGVFRNYLRYGAAGNNHEHNSGGFQWRSASAINRITIFPNAGNFIAGSHLLIYGVN